MKIKSFILGGLILPLVLGAIPAAGWGPVGHAVIGQAGVEGAAPPARAAVRDLLEAGSQAELEAAIDAACNWPDVLRETPEGVWSAPLHFVNMPRSVAAYDRQRDCPEGLCVTEGIVKFALELSRTELDRPRRRVAFAWLCHLVGDLHQPLHAGFRDDRGGNRVIISYRGETDDLHEFWDAMLTRHYFHGEDFAAGDLLSPRIDTRPWRPSDVVSWTEASHELAGTVAYPPGLPDDGAIDEAFAVRSWEIAWGQWRKAAQRLAAILDAALAAPGAPAGDP